MDTLVTYGLYLSEAGVFILGVQGKHSLTIGLTQPKQKSSGCFSLLLQHHSLGDFGVS